MGSVLMRRRKGPRAASRGLLDSQSVNTTIFGIRRGFDAGKEIGGRKQHAFIDTMGFIIALVVHSAALSNARGTMRCSAGELAAQALREGRRGLRIGAQRSGVAISRRLLEVVRRRGVGSSSGPRMAGQAV